MRIAGIQLSRSYWLCILAIASSVVAQDTEQDEEKKRAARPAARAVPAAQLVAPAAVQQILQKAQIRDKAIPIVPNRAFQIGGARPAQPTDPVKTQRQEYQQELEDRIDELDRVCTLEETQLKKLRLAARGAVDASMVEWKKRARQYAKRYAGRFANRGRGVAAARIVPPQKAAPAETESGDNRDKKSADPDDIFRELPASIFRSISRTMPSVRQNRIWIHTINNTLNPEQKTRYDAAVQSRRAFLREYRVRQRVLEMDAQLIFTPEQRARVFEIVDSVLGPEFSLEPLLNPPRSVTLYGEMTELRPNHLKDVLNAKQLKTFTKQMYLLQNTGRTSPISSVRIRLAALPGLNVRNVTLGAAFEVKSVPVVAPNAPRRMEMAVHRVTPNSPAARSGLKRGDVVTEIDGDVIDNINILADIYQRADGDQLSLKAMRGGKEIELTITLEGVD